MSKKAMNKHVEALIQDWVSKGEVLSSLGAMIQGLLDLQRESICLMLDNTGYNSRVGTPVQPYQTTQALIGATRRGSDQYHLEKAAAKLGVTLR